jgi:hypothetical protein
VGCGGCIHGKQGSSWQHLVRVGEIVLAKQGITSSATHQNNGRVVAQPMYTSKLKLPSAATPPAYIALVC